MKRRKGFLLVLMAIMLSFGFSAFDVAMPQTASVVQAKVKLNKKTLKLKKGKTAKLSVKGTKKKVKWSSSDTSVAKVSKKGKVKAVDVGTATITAIVGSKELECEVTVSTAMKSIVLNETKLDLFMGDTFTLVATTDNNAPASAIKWSSSNSSVASVDNVGGVKAHTYGTATISAIDKFGKAKATCLVRVKDIEVETPETPITLKSNEKVAGTDILSLTVVQRKAYGTNYLDITIQGIKHITLSECYYLELYDDSGTLIEDKMFSLKKSDTSFKKEMTFTNVKSGKYRIDIRLM